MQSQQIARIGPAAVVAAVIGLGSLSGAVMAAQDSDTFEVSATVQSVCTITANDLAFGSYDPSGGDVDAFSTIDVTCTNNTAFEIGLNGGTTSGNVADREMSGTGVNLNYALYSDSSRTQNWEDLGSTLTVTGTGDGTTQSVTVYGRLFGNQFSSAGLYTDTVTATVEFF